MTGLEFSQGLKVKYAWPGGYTMYLYMVDGSMMHWECAKKDAARIRLAAMNKGRFRTGWEPYAWGAFFEGDDETCSQCEEPICSEYGYSEEPGHER